MIVAMTGNAVNGALGHGIPLGAFASGRGWRGGDFFVGGLLCGAAVRGQRVAYEQQHRYKRQGEQQAHSAYVCFQYEILDDMLPKRDRLQKAPAQTTLQ